MIDGLQKNMTAPRERLTIQEFKSIAKSKGWTFIALAVRWNLSATRISQIANDANRPYYYDDAIENLPKIKKQAS